MAEIPIQRKKGGGIWPWLVGLLLLLILLWFFFWRNHDNATTAATAADSTMTVNSTTIPTPIPATIPATAPAVTAAGTTAAGASATAGMNPSRTSGAIGDFTRFIAVVGPNMSEEKQHAYTAGGLRRLADALASLGASGAPIANIRKQAAALQNSSANSTNHADMARSGFASAADAFNSLASKYPSTDVARVRSAADAMKIGPHLLDQKGNIQTFFETASTALHGMTSATAH